MAGRAAVSDEDRPGDGRIESLDRDDRWAEAAEPLHFDKPQRAGVGPGLAFAREMLAHRPGMQVGLVPCAVGGTAINEWQPGETLFEETIRRARIAEADGALSGIIWHQGETDADRATGGYRNRLLTVLRGFRGRLGQPRLPIVVGLLGDFIVAARPDASRINNIIAGVAEELEATACVAAEGLIDKGDGLHFDAASARELGRRYARAMLPLLPAE
jgi:hypothetical protein